ncbi:hypothetical protein CQ056_03800 [Peribacillus simplex]|nr:hypothetical protein CQ056_03800 [Peribacillus simplex]
MLPNSAAKDLSIPPSNGMPNMISPFYSAHPFVPSIIKSVIHWTFKSRISKDSLSYRKSISVLFGMKGDIRGSIPPLVWLYSFFFSYLVM